MDFIKILYSLSEPKIVCRNLVLGSFCIESTSMVSPILHPNMTWIALNKIRRAAEPAFSAHKPRKASRFWQRFRGTSRFVDMLPMFFKFFLIHANLACFMEIVVFDTRQRATNSSTWGCCEVSTRAHQRLGWLFWQSDEANELLKSEGLRTKQPLQT